MVEFGTSGVPDFTAPIEILGAEDVGGVITETHVSMVPEGVDPIEERIENWQDWVPIELKSKKPTKRQQQKIHKTEVKWKKWQANVNALSSPLNDGGVFKVPKSKTPEKKQ